MGEFGGDRALHRHHLSDPQRRLEPDVQGVAARLQERADLDLAGDEHVVAAQDLAAVEPDGGDCVQAVEAQARRGGRRVRRRVRW